MNWRFIFELLGDALGVAALFGTLYGGLLILHGLGFN